MWSTLNGLAAAADDEYGSADIFATSPLFNILIIRHWQKLAVVFITV